VRLVPFELEPGMASGSAESMRWPPSTAPGLRQQRRSAWRRKWFEACDALLWIVAFATIEINVLQIFRRNDSGNACAATSG